MATEKDITSYDFEKTRMKGFTITRLGKEEIIKGMNLPPHVQINLLNNK